MTSNEAVTVQGEATLDALEALQRLAPVTPDYATRPILDGFNWADCLAGVVSGQWYLVVFRSVRRHTADTAALIALDDLAHAEALAARGLLFYFKGQLDERRRCLSFCLWESQAQARLAADLPRHRAAARTVAAMYESYELERYLLTKADGRLELQVKD